MKRLFVLVAVFVSLTALTRAPIFPHASGNRHSLAVLGERADPATITVYITKTGEKYHRDGCRYLSRSRIPKSLKEAAKRCEPCKVCRPPVISAR